MLGRRADPGDAAVARGDRAALDDAEAGARRVERGEPRVRPDPINLHGASLPLAACDDSVVWTAAYASPAELRLS